MANKGSQLCFSLSIFSQPVVINQLLADYIPINEKHIKYEALFHSKLNNLKIYKMGQISSM